MAAWFSSVQGLDAVGLNTDDAILPRIVSHVEKLCNLVVEQVV